MKIRSKLVMLTTVFMVALTVGVTAVAIYSINQDKAKDLQKLRQQTLDNIIAEMQQKIDMATSFIEAELADNSSVDSQTARYVQQSAEAASKVVNFYYAQEQKGSLNRDQAQQQALAKIKELRNQVAFGGIFVHTLSKPYPRMLLATEDESLDGQLLFGERFNIDGKNAFSPSSELAESKGEGGLQLNWPIVGTAGSAYEVRSAYVKLMQPWGWVIGSEQVAGNQQEAKLELIKNVLRKMRYAEGEGYFWIISDDKPYPTMIMHPHQAYEGSVLDSIRYNNMANNGTEHLFAAIVNAVSNKQQGYLDTVWPKQIAAGEYTQPLPKPTYIAHIKKLGWIVGTGVWADHVDSIVAARTNVIEAQTKEVITRIIAVSIAILLLSIVSSFIFSTQISQALVSLTKITQAISLGGDLNTKIREVKRVDEVGDLAKSIVRLQTSVKLMMNRIRKSKNS